jgi:hypothetical protein
MWIPVLVEFVALQVRGREIAVPYQFGFVMPHTT